MDAVCLRVAEGSRAAYVGVGSRERAGHPHLVRRASCDMRGELATLLSSLARRFSTLNRVIHTPGLRGSLQKLLVDQAFFAPSMTTSFYTVSGILEHKSLEQITAKLQSHLWPTILRGYMVWPIVNLIMFRVRLLPLILIRCAAHSFAFTADASLARSLGSSFPCDSTCSSMARWLVCGTPICAGLMLTTSRVESSSSMTLPTTPPQRRSQQEQQCNTCHRLRRAPSPRRAAAIDSSQCHSWANHQLNTCLVIYNIISTGHQQRHLHKHTRTHTHSLK